MNLQTASMSRAAALPKRFTDRLAAAGYRRAEPAVLQPAEPFLDVMGEELRQRIFLTADASGQELCLRPDYTIPAALLHMASGAAEPASYFYEGPVFRHGANGGEAPQAGVEIFGRDDAVAADADTLALALEACAALGEPSPAIRLGDRAILEGAVEALDAPPAFRRRVKRTLTHGGSLDALGGADAREAGDAGLYAALAAAGPDAGRSVIEDLLKIAGIEAVGGRTAGEIADRFMERAAAHSVALHAPMKRALTSLIAIDELAPAALKRLEALAATDIPGARAAVEQLGRRLAAFEAAGLAVAEMRFSVKFGRGLDYYDGLTFELSPKAGGRPLAGGGRYDGLMSALGSDRPISGVGFALWLDRFAGAGS